MTIKSNESFWVKIQIIAFTMVLLFIAFYFDGTGEKGGDTIGHYLYSRYAFNHPILFFNHWAKPIFTIITSPFSQFGFNGIQVFNILVCAITIWFTYNLATHFKVKNPWLLPVFFYTTPYLIQAAVSGLTEPLFALLLVMAIYYTCTKRQNTGAIIISFLPFVRSEGLVMIGVFVLFFIISYRFKTLYLLATGHVVMSLVGYFYYHNLLWVFTEIPYAHLSSLYGSGKWFHFFIQLYFFFGPLLYTLLIFGIIFFVYTTINKKNSRNLITPKAIFLYAGFAVFFIAHMSFWALGIFGSMGLSRVFVGILPLMLIVMLDGYNAIVYYIKSIKIKNAIALVVVVFCLALNFTSNPAAVKPHDGILLAKDQLFLLQYVKPYVENKYPNKKIFCNECNIPYTLGIDWFNDDGGINLISSGLEKVDTNNIYIWDNLYCTSEIGLDKSYLLSNNILKIDTCFSVQNNQGNTSEFCVMYK